MEPVLSAPWAKKAETDGRYHPLICHLIDVAAVADSLWRNSLAPGLRDDLGAGLGLAAPTAAKLVALVAGLHDLGKLSPEFQLRDPAAADRLGSAGLHTAGEWVRLPHGIISAATLPELLTSECGVEMKASRRLADIIGGHHGVFATSKQVQSVGINHLGGKSWSDARRRHVRALVALLAPRCPMAAAAPDSAAALALAGLVSVADWIASMSERFPFAAGGEDRVSDLDLRDYADQSHERAQEVLAELGWLGLNLSSKTAGFSDLFPGLAARPLQEAAVDLVPAMGAPGIVVIEAPMGEGKTEAALYLADQAERSWGRLGTYVALPTQATSNQMLGRVRQFLTGRHIGDGIVLQLLHGHAALSAELELMRRLGKVVGVAGADGPEGQPAAVVAEEWFSQRKRGLLAPYGVGTIDQGLLAALQTRHAFVRLFGLAGKTVIIDEVHAYDVYMSSLLERLLEWLGALGTFVVLLSATLPSARRKALLEAFQRGGEIEALSPAADYPCLTWIGAGASGARSVNCSENSARRLRIDWIPAGRTGAEELAAEAVQKTADGGCLAIICNTVDRAQSIFETIQRQLPGRADDDLPMVDLLHSRFLFNDRQQRETRTLKRFGKPAAGIHRPGRAVLVATQIVEQSLDLDFDFMITDLAPADLILQRSGRLHRHQREGRPGGDQPVLQIVAPVLEAPAPRFDPGTRAVYDDHVLLRTWLALRDLSEVQIPEAVQSLIEQVYDERPCPAGLPAAVSAIWHDTLERRLEMMAAEVQEAQFRWLGRPAFDGPLYQLTRGELQEDASDFHRIHQALTRLSGPEVSVVCLADGPDGPTLPDGSVVDTQREPSLSLARRLLERSVGISSRRIVHGLLDEQPPAGWKKSSLLGHHRLLLLDAHQRCRRGSWIINYHPQNGLVIESEEGG